MCVGNLIAEALTLESRQVLRDWTRLVWQGRLVLRDGSDDYRNRVVGWCVEEAAKIEQG
jgi:hypothetical protein